jgi:hypothetical protein
MTTTNEPERRTRPFADFLAEHNRGAGHTRASEELQRVVTAVRDTGKKGVLTVKVSVEPMKNAPDTLLTTVVVDAKVPEDAPKAAVFYADEDGNLTRTDPNQLQFDGLREVDQPTLRDTDAAAAKAGEQ